MFLDVSTELLSEGYGIRFRPGGHSMHPTIRDGEALVVEPLGGERVRRGDILLYRRSERVIAHRVVSVEACTEAGCQLILRGDACRRPDEPVRIEQILGRVVAVERGGRLLKLSRRPRTFRRAARRALSRLNAFGKVILNNGKQLRLLRRDSRA